MVYIVLFLELLLVEWCFIIWEGVLWDKKFFVLVEMCSDFWEILIDVMVYYEWVFIFFDIDVEDLFEFFDLLFIKLVDLVY